MEPFKKIVTPGWSMYGQVFCKVEYDGRRLSFAGVEGPKRNGDAHGSCGQISHMLGKLNHGWSQTEQTKFREAWDAWHLNDMRAGCQHQRAQCLDKLPIDPSKPLNAYGKHFDGQAHDTWNMLIWVRPDEHPNGLLGSPCRECGYRYGTAWLYEEIPGEVLEYLAALPDSPDEPAWV